MERIIRERISEMEEERQIYLDFIRKYLLNNEPTGIWSKNFSQEEIARGYDWPGARCWVNPPLEKGVSIPVPIDGYFILNDGTIYVQTDNGVDYKLEDLIGKSLENIATVFRRNDLSGA